MPKINVELEVPDEYCDKPDNVCPMCVDDGVVAYCVAFNYALEEENYHCKRLKACKKAENARLTEKLTKETAKEILSRIKLYATDSKTDLIALIDEIAEANGVEVEE